jgi:hypothetical protein
VHKTGCGGLQPPTVRLASDSCLSWSTIGCGTLALKTNLAAVRGLNVTPHVAQNATRRSAIDGRTTHHPGYAVNQRIRKRVEEAFGWIKTTGGLRKTRHRGTARVGWMFTLTAVAANLVRLPKLIEAV